MPPRSDANARIRILEAGLRLFSELGFEGTTTRAIAARARVNLGLIKYYFGSKDALWRAVVDRVFGVLTGELGDLVSRSATDADAIVDLARTCVRFAGHNPAFVRLMNDECKRKSPRMRWLVERHIRPMYDATVGLMGHMKRQGLVPAVADVHLYYMFIGAAGMLFSQAPECKKITGTDPTTDDQMIEAHADAVVKLFFRNS